MTTRNAERPFFGRKWTRCSASTVGGAFAGAVAAAAAGAAIAAIFDDSYWKIAVIAASALLGAVGGLAAGAALACWSEHDEGGPSQDVTVSPKS